MFVDIKEYIEETRDIRRSHLNLDEPCIEIGGDSREFRGHLAHYLGTTIPRGMKIMLCHACHNAKCSNPRHHYWGTASDNVRDGRHRGTIKTVRENTIKKHGRKIADQLHKRAARAGGLKSGGRNCLTQEVIDYRRNVILTTSPPQRGWVTKSSNLLGITHTQVRRFVEKYMSGVSSGGRAQDF